MQDRCVVGGSSSTTSLGERAILLLQYLYLAGTHPEARKRRKKCADLCIVRLKEGAIKQFFDFGFAATVKT